ncbi:MAG: hypothetical protein ACLPPT_19610 [Mycobacterium sp.]|uniref:hypothetical protein n=1 Tax=Mycobacterium sp. TaxID=1785 RepID=UPI002CC185A6|nr:hypothetical protein [Mycobacterium sp.]
MNLARKKFTEFKERGCSASSGLPLLSVRLAARSTPSVKLAAHSADGERATSPGCGR